MNKNRLYKFLIGVAVWVAAFLYNRFVSTENAIFILVNSFLTLILIGIFDGAFKTKASASLGIGGGFVLMVKPPQ